MLVLCNQKMQYVYNHLFHVDDVVFDVNDGTNANALVDELVECVEVLVEVAHCVTLRLFRFVFLFVFFWGGGGQLV